MRRAGLPGELDTTFGSGGRVIDTLGYDIVSVRAMARQPDGRLVQSPLPVRSICHNRSSALRASTPMAALICRSATAGVRISPTNGAGFAIPNAIAIEPI